MFDTSEWITDNVRPIIAVMLIASAIIAAGVPKVDRSTSIDQF
jgi:hypothetical protein